jgi:hypothetical protein
MPNEEGSSMIAKGSGRDERSGETADQEMRSEIVKSVTHSI